MTPIDIALLCLAILAAWVGYCLGRIDGNVKRAHDDVARARDEARDSSKRLAELQELVSQYRLAMSAGDVDEANRLFQEACDCFQQVSNPSADEDPRPCQHAPIEMTTYRVEAPHPSRPEISMFTTTSRLDAMYHEEHGWTVTPSVLSPGFAELQERIALFGAAVSHQADEEATRLYLQICNGFKQADAELTLRRIVRRHRVGKPLVLPEEWPAIEAIALRNASPLRAG